jgi:hypothetical protein
VSTSRAISRPRHSSGARLRWLLSILAFGVLLSCRGEEGLPPEDAAEREAAAAEAAIDWPCEAKGYPCTWEEVSAEATERTFALADQALDRFEPGGARELVDWLEAQPGVVEAGEEDPTVVWFRVEGGRQIFVQGPLPPTGIERVEGRAGTASSELHPDVHLASTGGLLIEGFDALSSMLRSSRLSEPGLLAGVTGRDRNVDRRVNQRDQRKAIILEPMDWEFCYESLEGQYDRLIGEPGIDKRRVDRLKRENSRTIESICDGKGETSALKGLGTAATPYLSEGAAVRDVLEEMPAYAGHVTLLRDEQVNVAVLGRLKEYDVVHFNTHGSRRSVTLGTSVDWSGRGRVRGAPARRRGLSAIVFKAGKHGPRRRSWSADQNFFRSLHPRGLDRTLIFLSSCSGLGHPDKKTPPLANALLGKESMLVGWGVTIGLQKAQQTAVSFYLHLAEGWSGKEAIRRIPDAYGSPVFADEPARREDITPAQADMIRMTYPRGGVDEYMAEYGPEGELKRGAVFGSRGGDMRIREVTRLLHPPSPLSAPGQRRPLVDGDDLEFLVVGELGDDVRDQIRVSVEVERIRDEERGSTSVQLELDGRKIGKPKTLSEGMQVEEEIYRLDFEDVPVEKDLKPEEEYELEAVVSLPEGGESRYAAKLKGEECPVVIQGDFEGQLGGGHAQLFERGRNTQAKIFLHEEGGRLPGFRLPQQFHLDQRGGGRNGWAFNFNAVLDGPVVPGARFRVERRDLMDPQVDISGSYRESKEGDAMQFPLGGANIVLHRVRWVANSERAARQGMACGEVEANLEGLVPGTYPYQFMPHTFRATFWAEIRRE